MLVDRAKFEDIYSDIRASATDGGCSVLILVAPEADALAACRIVTAPARAHTLETTTPLGVKVGGGCSREDDAKGKTRMRSYLSFFRS